MKTTNFLDFIFCLTIVLSSCKAQTKDTINLSKIIFHSSRCNGDCPQYDLEIDSNKQIFVNREYFKDKDEIKTQYSGQFHGVLIQDDYNKLLRLLQNCNLDTLQFPNIECCDAVITTIIVYYKGQRKYLKSMETPTITNNLIVFLKAISRTTRDYKN